MELAIHLADDLKTKTDESNLGFGIHFTDHMFNMDYTPDKGWYNPRIEPHTFIEMAPACVWCFIMGRLKIRAVGYPGGRECRRSAPRDAGTWSGK